MDWRQPVLSQEITRLDSLFDVARTCVCLASHNGCLKFYSW